jgi:hypothetical protein
MIIWNVIQANDQKVAKEKSVVIVSDKNGG